MSTTQQVAKQANENISLYANVVPMVLQGTGMMLFDMACTFLTMYVGAQLSKDMFSNVLKKVMKAPVNLYFDITPIEKVIGFFTGDIDRCDRHFWGCLEWISH
jgi:N-acetylglutamate synthase/N-acetylornithine aminotransferase